MPTIVRTVREARLWCKALMRSGATHMPPDNTTVLGHCVGMCGRAYCNGPAGYDDAHEMIDVNRAKIHQTPASGDIALYRGGAHGHAAIVCVVPKHRKKPLRRVKIMTVDMPKAGRIGRVSVLRPTRRWPRGWSYTLVGFLHPDDVAGWRGSVDKPLG